MLTTLWMWWVEYRDPHRPRMTQPPIWYWHVFCDMFKKPQEPNDPFKKTTEFIEGKQTSRELRPATIEPTTEPGDRLLNRRGAMVLAEVSPDRPDYSSVTNGELSILQPLSLDTVGRLRVFMDAPINASGTITVTGSVSIIGTPTVIASPTGTTTVTGSVTVGGTATVAGSVSLLGTSTIAGSVSLLGTSTIAGSVSLLGTSTIAGSVSILGTSTVTGTVTVVAEVNSATQSLTVGTLQPFFEDTEGSLRVNPFGSPGSFQQVSATAAFNISLNAPTVTLVVPAKTKWRMRNALLIISSSGGTTTRTIFLQVIDPSSNFIYIAPQTVTPNSATGNATVIIDYFPGAAQVPIAANGSSITGALLGVQPLAPLDIGPGVSVFGGAIVTNTAGVTPTMTVTLSLNVEVEPN